METINDNVKYEVHTDEVNEIIGKVNGRLINHGLTFFVIILLTVLVFSWFVRYPDIITGEAVLRAEDAPRAVIAHVSGKIDSIVVEEGNFVEAGNPLAYIESNTDPSNIVQLENFLKLISDKLDNGGRFEDITYNLPTNVNLGELQTSFQSFLLSYNSMTLLVNQGFYDRNKAELVKNLANAKEIASTLQKQKQIYVNDLDLAKQDYEALSKLYDRKVISAAEFRQEKSRFLAKGIPLEAVNNSILNNKSAINSDLRSLLVMEQDLLNTKLDFLRNLKSFRNEISIWKKKYIVTAPISGSFSLSEIVAQGKNAVANETLFYVVPKNDMYYAEMWLSQRNFGKVKTGQVVKLKFESFPYQVFGSIEGKVHFISKIAKDGVFLVKVSVPDLITDEKKEIAFRNGLKASGDIITEKNRLIEKMFHSFKAIYKKN